MKTYQLLMFLLLIATTIGVSQVYGVEDNDNDGVPNDIDQCPNLKEDYLGVIDGCT